MGIKSKALRKIVSIVALFTLLFQQLGFAQMAVELNLAGRFTQTQGGFAMNKFRLPHLRYLSYDNNADNIRIFLDKGDIKDTKDDSLKESAQLLLKYFLIGVTLPDENFWVNLRPDSSENIISGPLEQTDIGKIFLETDVQLKKDTARFTSPQTKEGKAYWDKLYQKANELYGSENVTIPTLTRPWIVPDEIIIRQSGDSAYIYKANLKVMLEQDYLKGSAEYSFADERSKQLNEYSSQLIRELVLPELTKEVNNGKRYANLRQVYYSLILARWFKANFAGKGGLYSSYINKQDLNGLTSAQGWSKNTYFKQYQDSFKNGEYNLKVPVNTLSGPSIRSYFSGGIELGTGKIGFSSQSSSAVAAFTGTSNLLPMAAVNAGMVPFTAIAANPQSIVLTPGIVNLPGASSSPVKAEEVVALSDLVKDNIVKVKDKVRRLELTREKLNERKKVLEAQIEELRDPKIILEKKSEIVAKLKRDGFLKDYPGFGYVYEKLDQALTSLAKKKIVLDERHPPTTDAPGWPQRLEYYKNFSPSSSDTSDYFFLYVSRKITTEGVSIIISGKWYKSWYSHDHYFDASVDVGFDMLAIQQKKEKLGRVNAGLTMTEKSIKRLNARKAKFETALDVIKGAPRLSSASSPVAPQEIVEKTVDYLADTVVNYYEITPGKIDLADIKAEIRRFLLKEGDDFRFSLGLAKSTDGDRFMSVSYLTPQGKVYMDESADLGLMVMPKELSGLLDTIGIIQDSAASSPVKQKEISVPDKKGGIDFRALPMTIQPIGSFQDLNLSLPELANLAQINISEELSQIKKMLDGGIAPSGDRIKELLAACYHKSELADHAEELMLCLIRICKLQEDMVVPSDNSLKEAIVIVDSL